MFEFLSFELIVHDSAGGVVFRVVTWITTVIIGAVRALCENAPLTNNECLALGQWATKALVWQAWLVCPDLMAASGKAPAPFAVLSPRAPAPSVPRTGLPRR